MVSPLCVAVPVELSRSANEGSENEGSFLVSQLHVVSPATEGQSDADGFLFAQPWCASPVGVSGCTENIQHMAFRLSPDRNSILGSNRLSGGLFSEGKWSVTLDFVPRLVGPSFPDLFLEFLRTGSLDFGVSGKGANSYSSKDLLSLPREVMLVEEAADFSVGFGEAKMSDYLPLQIIAPSLSTISTELEEATEVLSIEPKLDISGRVKHRIPGFSKLVGLSTTRHEKLCIALLQRLETKMEATNVLHRKETGNKKVAKSKNRGRRELKNLICLVNYDRR